MACVSRAMQEQTLEKLYDAHAKTVYWAAYGVTRNADAAKDAVQNAFLSAHRNMETLQSMTSEQCRAWLYRCAVNSSIDMLRRNKRSIPTEDAGVREADRAPGPETRAQQNEETKALHEALRALPEKYRQPLYLYYFAEMDYHQVAQALQMNEGTLKSRMSRGRKMLEVALRKGGGIDA